MAGSGNSQVAVNGSTSGFNPTVQDEINLALTTNGGFKRIEAAYKQRLDEAGWSQNLKEYATRLFRSGEATTYDDALAIIMKQIKLPGEPEDEAAPNGTTDVPDLSIPMDAVEGGADAVKKELRQILKPKK